MLFLDCDILTLDLIFCITVLTHISPGLHFMIKYVMPVYLNHSQRMCNSFLAKTLFSLSNL